MSTLIIHPAGFRVAPKRLAEPDLPKAERARSTAPTADTIDEASDNRQLFRAMKLGFIVGAPATFLVAAGIALAAGATIGESALIGAWTGLTSGGFFGDVAFLHPSSDR